MAEHIDDVSGDSLSRRTALKRLGAGTALAWTAPAVLSHAPAFGQTAGSVSPGACGCPDGGPSTCQGGQGGVECPGGPGGFVCFCWERAEGGTVCATFADTSTCNADTECPPGQVCVVCEGNSCGCGSTGRACAPICDGCVAPRRAPASTAQGANPARSGVG